jgi:protein-tyrosine phosphatase
MSLPVITGQFGTLRGAVRLGLAYGEVAAGLSAQRKPDPDGVRRLVFVCHGNICRSAYAHGLAQAAGARVASFGLSTSTGKPAHPPVVALAKARGLSLAAHRSTDVADFVGEEGDLLLAMETRHLRKFAADPALRDVPRELLGMYVAPLPVPHLHDPYELDDRYMATCLTRIETAVANLLRRYPRVCG